MSSSSSPEPPSPSSSRPPGSSASPSPSAEAPPPPRGPAPHGGDLGPPRDLALFEEELATRPRVPAVLRRMAPYSALSPDSDRGPGPRPGALRAVALPALQTPLGLVLVLRLPWVVATGGLLQAGAIALLLGACTALTSVSLSAVATNGPDPGGCPLSLLSGALGPEAGGAVGLCGFLSAAFTAAAAALGAAELIMVYAGPGAAVPRGSGRSGRLNAGRGLGAALLALLALAAACPHAEPMAAPATPAGLALALLGLAAGTVRNAISVHTLCWPNGPRGYLEPCEGNGSQRNRLGPGTHLLQQNLWPRPPEEEEEDEDWSFGALLGMSLLSAAGPLWGCGSWGALGDAPRSVAAGSLGAASVTTVTCTRIALAALALGGGSERRLLRPRWSGGPWGAWWPGPWVPALSGLVSGAAVGQAALTGGARLLRGLARTRALPLPHALGSGRLWPLAATSAMSALGVLLGSLDLVAPVLSVLPHLLPGPELGLRPPGPPAHPGMGPAMPPLPLGGVPGGGRAVPGAGSAAVLALRPPGPRHRRHRLQVPRVPRGAERVGRGAAGALPQRRPLRPPAPGGRGAPRALLEAAAAGAGEAGRVAAPHAAPVAGAGRPVTDWEGADGAGLGAGRGAAPRPAPRPPGRDGSAGGAVGRGRPRLRAGAGGAGGRPGGPQRAGVPGPGLRPRGAAPQHHPAGLAPEGAPPRPGLRRAAAGVGGRRASGAGGQGAAGAGGAGGDPRRLVGGGRRAAAHPAAPAAAAPPGVAGQPRAALRGGVSAGEQPGAAAAAGGRGAAARPAGPGPRRGAGRQRRLGRRLRANPHDGATSTDAAADAAGQGGPGRAPPLSGSERGRGGGRGGGRTPPGTQFGQRAAHARGAAAERGHGAALGGREARAARPAPSPAPAPRLLRGVPGGADGGPGAGAAGAGGRRHQYRPVWTSTDQYHPSVSPARAAAPSTDQCSQYSTSLSPSSASTSPVWTPALPVWTSTDQYDAGLSPGSSRTSPVWTSAPSTDQDDPSMGCRTPSIAPVLPVCRQPEPQLFKHDPSMDQYRPVQHQSEPCFFKREPSTSPALPV